MYKCPHCGKPGIGYIRKHFIGLWLPATCKSCGKHVHNDGLKAVLATLPLILCVLISSAIADVSKAYMVMGAGMAMMILLNIFWVPLVKEKREPKKATRV
jgi:phosphotransferase system  glucose/maltose/N-acetylglucosamine-specific IIC component